ncbi:MAG: hypothetical protein KBT33_01660 [Prevotellaceae bacterium]|nr:hypothetical protein [Candidatus Minthosoma equi]
MKKNYEAPKMEQEIILEEELLIEGSGIDMGGEGVPDAKDRLIEEITNEVANEVADFQDIW